MQRYKKHEKTYTQGKLALCFLLFFSLLPCFKNVWKSIKPANNLILGKNLSLLGKNYLRNNVF